MIDEQRRHDLIDAFIASHGRETAMTLADGLFTEHVTRADLDRFATKADLKAVEARLAEKIDNCATKADVAAVGAKTDAVEARLAESLRTQFYWFIAVTATLVSVATALILHRISQIAPG